MPMRSDGIKRGRIRRRRSELDSVAEDPRAELDPSGWEHEQNKRNADLSDSVGEDVSADDEAWGKDEYEGWGPIRLRPGHLRDAH